MPTGLRSTDQEEQAGGGRWVVVGGWESGGGKTREEEEGLWHHLCAWGLVCILRLRRALCICASGFALCEPLFGRRGAAAACIRRPCTSLQRPSHLPVACPHGGVNGRCKQQPVPDRQASTVPTRSKPTTGTFRRVCNLESAESLALMIDLFLRFQTARACDSSFVDGLPSGRKNSVLCTIVCRVAPGQAVDRARHIARLCRISISTCARAFADRCQPK